VAVSLRRFAQGSAHAHIFPEALTIHTVEGPWLQEFQPDLQKVLEAKKKHRRRQATRVLKAVSEHHTGQIVQILRSQLGTFAPHPMVPDAHAPQFFPKGTDPNILTVAEQFFKVVEPLYDDMLIHLTTTRTQFNLNSIQEHNSI
jgi:hypothetical protein